MVVELGESMKKLFSTLPYRGENAKNPKNKERLEWDEYENGFFPVTEANKTESCEEFDCFDYIPFNMPTTQI